MISRDYAKALFALDKPSVKRLREVLETRGHVKLLPQIFSEYQKLKLQKERSQMHSNITPERERNRVLLELYKKLTA